MHTNWQKLIFNSHPETKEKKLKIFKTNFVDKFLLILKTYLFLNFGYNLSKVWLFYLRGTNKCLIIVKFEYVIISLKIRNES